MSHLDDDAVAVTTRGASSSIPMGVIFVQQVLQLEIFYSDMFSRYLNYEEEGELKQSP